MNKDSIKAEVASLKKDLERLDDSYNSWRGERRRTVKSFAKRSSDSEDEARRRKAEKDRRILVIDRKIENITKDKNQTKNKMRVARNKLATPAQLEARAKFTRMVLKK